MKDKATEEFGMIAYRAETALSGLLDGDWKV